ncbi:MAG: hypothetical protein LCH85_15445 [Chloroflexi bacterium]|nr:hypothetical protein [Chloroflexota bacterium]
MDDATSQRLNRVPTMQSLALWRSQARIVRWRWISSLSSITGLSLWAITLSYYNAMLLIQTIMPTIIVWLSVGCLIDDPTIELSAATGLGIRRLWWMRSSLIIGPSWLVIMLCTWVVANNWLVFGYSNLAMFTAFSLSHWLARMTRNSLIGAMLLSFMLLTQWVAPFWWLPMVMEQRSGLEQFKQYLFFPLDSHEMYLKLHHERMWNMLTLGSLGLVTALWGWWLYGQEEALILPKTE